jgi:hypothetical protein
MSTDRVEELRHYGCIDPEEFANFRIQRFAEHTGLDIEPAFQMVIGELAALSAVRDENFRQMLETGFARKIVRMYSERGVAGLVGERPLIVMDNYVHLYEFDDPVSTEDNYITFYDPLHPLTVRNFHTAEDPKATRLVGSITIGRPNSDGELWLGKGITVEDYDVVADCFKRLLALRENGTTPHLLASLDHIFLPYGGYIESLLQSADIGHGPVEYSGVTTELKVAA